MRVLQARDSKQRMERDESLLLINVLDPDAFEKQHVPGSHNIPQSRTDFVSQVQEVAGRGDGPIVVYCASTDCTASPTAARKLTEAGFSDVADFEGGMAEWKRLGFDIETGAPVASR